VLSRRGASIIKRLALVAVNLLIINS